MRHSLVSLLFTLTACIVVGCRSDGPPPPPEGVEVSGKAFLPNGNPMPGGILVLRPEGGTHGVSASVQANGQFTLARPSGETNVVPGKYRVFVKFSDPAQSALRSTVGARYQNTEDGDSDILVEITGPKSDLVIRFKK